MRIEVKDHDGRPRLTLHVDPQRPPTVVRAEDGRGPALTLDWEAAVDDAGRLRHCPVCGCEELYVRRAVPTMAGFVLVLVGGVLALWLMGSGLAWLGAGVLVAVLLVELGLVVWVERQLVCYRCGAVFRGLPRKDGRSRWDASVAARYADEPDKPTPEVFGTRIGGTDGAAGGGEPSGAIR